MPKATLITLDNFDEENTEPPILTSPRSLEACAIEGILPLQLCVRDALYFDDIEATAKNVLQRQSHYEGKRQERLRMCRAARQALISKKDRGDDLDNSLNDVDQRLRGQAQRALREKWKKEENNLIHELRREEVLLQQQRHSIALTRRRMDKSESILRKKKEQQEMEVMKRKQLAEERGPLSQSITNMKTAQLEADQQRWQQMQTARTELLNARLHVAQEEKKDRAKKMEARRREVSERKRRAEEEHEKTAQGIRQKSESVDRHRLASLEKLRMDVSARADDWEDHRSRIRVAKQQEDELMRQRGREKTAEYDVRQQIYEAERAAEMRRRAEISARRDRRAEVKRLAQEKELMRLEEVRAKTLKHESKVKEIERARETANTLRAAIAQEKDKGRERVRRSAMLASETKAANSRKKQALHDEKVRKIRLDQAQEMAHRAEEDRLRSEDRQEEMQRQQRKQDYVRTKRYEQRQLRRSRASLHKKHQEEFQKKRVQLEAAAQEHRQQRLGEVERRKMLQNGQLSATLQEADRLSPRTGTGQLEPTPPKRRMPYGTPRDRGSCPPINTVLSRIQRNYNVGIMYQY